MQRDELVDKLGVKADGTSQVPHGRVRGARAIPIQKGMTLEVECIVDAAAEDPAR